MRAVFKRLSKVISLSRLLHLLIGMKLSRTLFNKWQAEPCKPISSCTCFFPCTLALFAPVVIGLSNSFRIDFWTVIWKPLCKLIFFCQTFDSFWKRTFCDFEPNKAKIHETLCGYCLPPAEDPAKWSRNVCKYSFYWGGRAVFVVLVWGWKFHSKR